MIKLNSRGSVLVHVLVTGVVVAVMAAGMLRMVMMNYVAVDRATKGAANRKEADSMLNRALSAWNLNGVCTAFIGATCDAGTPPCNCTGTAATGSITPPTIAVGGASPPHTITVISSDPE